MILIVQSEEAKTAAQEIVGEQYQVMLPPQDTTVLKDEHVLLWPHADQPSRILMRLIAKEIAPIASEVKFILPNGQPEGWNAVHAKNEGWDYGALSEWAKSRVVVFHHYEEPEQPIAVPTNVEQIWDECAILRNKQGPLYNLDNVQRLVAGAFKNLVWFDQFHQKVYSKSGEWTDIDTYNLTVQLQRIYSFHKLNDDLVHKAVIYVAHQNPKNQPRDWMESLKWDGTPRIDRFMIDYMGAVDAAYNYAISRNFWLSMVARIYRPGCQMDSMVVLEGKQGTFKTSALRAIGQEWYMEAHEQITSKDFFVSLQGRLIVEISELDSFSKADSTRVKQVITCNNDRFRAPYGTGAKDYPRQCIFVGTTNESTYLRDNTGARRFWPVRCSRINLPRIKEDRSQLFAEAVSRFKEGEDWYMVPIASLAEQQEERRQADEWENVISMFLVGKNEVSILEISGHLGIAKDKLDMQIQRRLGSILRHLEWYSRTVRRDFTIQRIWSPISSRANES